MIDLLKNRRSIRKYKSDKIRNEEIDLILKSALLAPSSMGRKPWEFIVIDDKELLQLISKCRTKGGGPFIKNASHVIVVIGDTSKCDVWIEDCTISAILMQLEAHKLGIGSCWVQVRERMHDANKSAEEYIRDVLNIPQAFSVECIISLGYSDEVKEDYDENKLQFEKIHRNKF